MNVSIRHVAIAAALCGVSAAQAAVITAVPGTMFEIKDDARGVASTGRKAAIAISSATGSLYFSNGQADPTVLPATRPNSIGGLVGALNVGKVEVAAIDGATKDEQTRTVGRSNTITRAVVGVNATVTGLTADTATGAFSTVTTRGGAAQTAYYIEGILEGGKVTVNNLSLDISDANNVKVSGNLSGNALTNFATSAAGAEYGPTENFSGVLWNQAKISGPTSLPPAELIAAADGNVSQLQARGYTLLGIDNVVHEGRQYNVFTVQANNLITNLQVTEAAFNAFASTLGLTEGGTGYTTLQGVNGTGGWGVMKSSITFQFYEDNCLSCGINGLSTQLQLPLPAVPEPESWALMALGLVGMAWRTRARWSLNNAA